MREERGLFRCSTSLSSCWLSKIYAVGIDFRRWPTYLCLLHFHHNFPQFSENPSCTAKAGLRERSPLPCLQRHLLVKVLNYRMASCAPFALPLKAFQPFLFQLQAVENHKPTSGARKLESKWKPAPGSWMSVWSKRKHSGLKLQWCLGLR